MADIAVSALPASPVRSPRADGQWSSDGLSIGLRDKR